MDVGSGDTAEFPAGWVPRKRRRWKRALGIVVALLVIAGAVGGGIWFATRDGLDTSAPMPSARRVFNAIRTHDEDALRKRIDTRQGEDPRDGAKVITKFFRGWRIDARSLKILDQADDNGYTIGFKARRPDGTGAEIHGSLWAQGDPGPWKLSGLWVDHGNWRRSRSIF